MDAKIQSSLDKKAELGLLPPQECRKCQADLSDPDVPTEYAEFARMFGLAMEVQTGEKEAAWRCPVCDHVWLPHPLVR